MTAPWADSISADDEQRYAAAGFGHPIGMGSRPALLIIDLQYRSTGSRPMPFFEALEEYRTSCGDVGWAAVTQVHRLLTRFRAAGWPVLYPFVAPKQEFDAGALGAKVPAIMDISAAGYRFVDEIAPQQQDVLLPKRHPSAFFGTPLVSYLVARGIDSLVVTGATTSGCVRSTVVDGFAYNFKITVPSDAVYDRTPTVHQVNLFDMAQKYADVMSTDEVLAALARIPAALDGTGA